MRMLTTAVVLAAVALTPACKGSEQDARPGMDDDDVIRPRADPIEFVGLTVRQQADRKTVLNTLSGIFGDDAKAGKGHSKLELQPGVFLTVEPDDRTSDQVAIQLDMRLYDVLEDRTIAKVPATLGLGSVFIDTVEAAIDKTEEDYSDMHTWHLEYRTVSFNGGHLTVMVGFDEGDDDFYLEFKTENPRTSLFSGQINQPAFTGEPYEYVSGTVFFSLTRDQFSFFSHRAYGITGGADQNFDDFQLLPHSWLRITVVPLLPDPMVDVQFEVVTLDGERVPIARSPASLIAGEQFQQNVFRLVENMEAQEGLEAGSSTPFTTQFHYDDPQGGGVVKVIFNGDKGDYQVAYVVESPLNFLRDTDFVPYQGTVDLPDEDDLGTEDKSCEELGSEDALEGNFILTFDASETVRESSSLDGSLRGPVWHSIYKAEDVTISGPIEGAEPVASFDFDDVDIRNGPSKKTYTVKDKVPLGEYQILGFMDIDGNADDANADPDVNDPVTLPIGGYEMKCAETPATIEYALLLPEDF